MNDDFSRMVADHLTTEEAKEERAFVRVWVGRVLALVALLVTTVYATGAYAQIPVHTYEEKGKVAVQLLDVPCVDEFALMMLSQAPEYKDRAKGLTSQWLHTDDQKMHPYGGCWLEISKKETGTETVIFMMFSDGQRIVVPKTLFTKKPGQVGV